VLSVVRTPAWGLGAEEDVWQVEVPATATVADLKAKIEELYEVPIQAQQLALASGAPAEAALSGDAKAETLEGKKVYLDPAPSGTMEAAMDPLFGGLMPGGSPDEEAAFAGMAEALMGAAQEAQEVDQALMESLQGVTYKVNFERPSDVGGCAAGKKVQLDLDALALAGDVQQMVEVELFGAVDKEPVFLVFEGRPLMPQIPLFHAGIEDGKTVVVAKERPPPTEEEQLLSMLGGGTDGVALALGGPPAMAA